MADFGDENPRQVERGRERPAVTDEGYDIRIAADGTWFHEGAPIRRPALVRLFASVLRRDEAGDYWLVTPAERGRIKVEDVPFVAVELAIAGSGSDQALDFVTNIGERVEAGPDRPIALRPAPDGRGPVPYLSVGRGLEARIARPVYYELAALAVDRDGRQGVWTRGAFFPLDRVP